MPAQIAPTTDPIAVFDDAATYRVAIIGVGPRGLAAAERLAHHAAQTDIAIALTCIDTTAQFGAGPNYDPGQPDLNRLNIALRSIDIPCPRYKGALPLSFEQWLEHHVGVTDPEYYPARAELGNYLHQRWQMLAKTSPDPLSIKTVNTRVKEIVATKGAWELVCDPIALGPFDTVLLTLGHQTTTDAQIEKWRTHATASGAVLMPAYPSAAIVENAHGWKDTTVAIRGLGLSTIDVVRLLTLGQGGRFQTGPNGLIYQPSGNEPHAIVPFSRDGIPPAPKPASAELDAGYDLGEQAEAHFVDAVSNIVANSLDHPLERICDTVLDLSSPVCARFELPREAVATWLAVERAPNAHHRADRRAVRKIIAHHLAMAEGKTAPSPGYLVGQIWRKLQTALRRAFNPLTAHPTIAEEIVRFDEGMKRFSYGPPPRAMHEILALIDAGLLDLRAVNDPDIVAVENGWRLSTDVTDRVVTVMIDAVLPPPDLEATSTPLIAGLRAAGLVSPAGAKLGTLARPDGTVVDTAGRDVGGLTVLGRLATGSVIATDSVHDCFGAASDRWARGVVSTATGAARGAP